MRQTGETAKAAVHHADPGARVDGRRLRSLRTRLSIIEAYLAVAHEKSPQVPTAAQIAERAGCSVRSVFERFPDIHSLQVAVVDHVLAQLTAPLVPVGSDRWGRIMNHVETRGRNCERWLPLWRSLMVNQGESVDLRQRAIMLRRRVTQHIEARYAPELSSLSDAERRHLLIVLEALLDVERWAGLKEFFGLSFEEACAVWAQALDRLLPSTPASA